jgi:hypothetical protein
MGSQLESLSPVVAAASSAPQRPAQTIFNAVAGTTYAIALDSIGEGAALLKLILSAAANNDNFAAATDLGGNPPSAVGSTFGATREAGESFQPGASVWFRWTAPSTRGYALKLQMPAAFYFPGASPPGVPPPPIPAPEPTYAGLRFPVIAVYRGDALTNLTRVAAAASAQGFETILTLNAMSGLTYSIAVDEAFGVMSDFSFWLTSGANNDNFVNAAAIGLGQAINFNTLGATRELGEPQHAGQPGGASLWWTWTAPTNGMVAFDAWLDNGLPVAVVYAGNSLTNLVPLGAVAPTNFLHPIVVHALAGTTYWLAADEVTGRPATGFVKLVAAPSNDDFERRQTVLTSRMVTGSTYGATHEPGEPDHGYGTNSASVWWTWIAPSNGLYGVHDGSYSLLERIYLGGTLANLKAVATREVPLAQDLPRVEFEASGGIAYQIAFDAATGRGSGFDLSIFPVPANDHFANRIVLEGVSNLVQRSAANATREGGELPIVRSGSLWWSWISPTAGAAYITASNSSTWVQVFTNRHSGSPVTLSNLAYLTATYGSPLRAEFATASNATYFFAAGSTAWQKPTVNFALSFNPLPQLAGQWHPPSFQWATSPLNPWFRQTNTVFDPADAAESGHQPSRASSQMSATILGPGTISFWWKVATPENRREDLFFTRNPSIRDTLVGPRDWTQHIARLGPGTNTVTWTFSGQPFDASPAATAWVDRVEFVPAQPAAAVLDMTPVPWWGSANAGLRLLTEAGRVYRIDTSTNLQNWAEWTNIVGADWPIVLEVPLRSNLQALYFRAVTE